MSMYYSTAKCVFCHHINDYHFIQQNQCSCGADILYIRGASVFLFTLYFDDNFEIVKDILLPSKYRIQTDGEQIFNLQEKCEHIDGLNIKSIIEYDYFPNINIDNVCQFVRKYIELKAFT